MQLSPLQLEGYTLKDIRFSVVSTLDDIPDENTQYDQLGIEVSAETRMRDNDPLLWRSQITIRSKEEGEGTYPYSFELVYVGFFRVVKEFPSQYIEQMVKANAPALLYSAAREAMVYLTGRGVGLPGVLLPSITFIEPPSQPPRQGAKSGSKKAIARKK